MMLLVEHEFFQGSSSSDADEGSGVAAVQTRSVPSFTGVELAGSNLVSVHEGAERSVVVRADDNLIDRVTTEVVDGKLVIGTVGSFDPKSPMSVEVTTPSVDAVTLSGSGIVALEDVQAPRLALELTGSGVLRASGTVTSLDVSLGGAGDAQLEGLVARDARAVVSGSGRILVHATSALDASVPGSGAIVYTGDPAHVTTSVTGSGAVIRG